MYPQTALEALNLLNNIEHEYIELIIERDSWGAPYLSGRTDQGWTIVWQAEDD